jgi:hypothetical protein
MHKHRYILPAALVLVVVSLSASAAPAAEPACETAGAKADAGLRRYIYSLHPDGSQGGGPKSKDGIVVLDIDNGCSYVRRIPLPCLAEKYGGHGARGIVGHTATRRLYYTFMLTNAKTNPTGKGAPVVGCLDLERDRVLWEVYLRNLPEAKGHDVGAGNPAVTHDGKKLYIPPEWTGGNETTVLDASDGKLIAFVPTGGNGCGNAILSPDGKFVYASKDATRINTATDQIEWNVPAPGASPAKWKGNRPPQGPCPGHSHYMIDATGERMFGTYECQGEAAIVYSTRTGEILDRLSPPQSGPLDFFWKHWRTSDHPMRKFGSMSHEGSFTPSGTRFWVQSMEHLPAPPDAVWAHVVQVDATGGNASGSLFRGCANINWVTEWDVSRAPAALVKVIATRSPGHSHAHALVTREGDLVLTGDGYALDTGTGKHKATWKDEDGKWFQGTKFMQVNFRDGKPDWVGQRHGTGWLYHVPSLSEAGAKESKP